MWKVLNEIMACCGAAKQCQHTVGISAAPALFRWIGGVTHLLMVTLNQWMLSLEVFVFDFGLVLLHYFSSYELLFCSCMMVSTLHFIRFAYWSSRWSDGFIRDISNLWAFVFLIRIYLRLSWFAVADHVSTFFEFRIMLWRQHRDFLLLVLKVFG